jgi:hypothetical protein
VGYGTLVLALPLSNKLGSFVSSGYQPTLAGSFPELSVRKS